MKRRKKKAQQADAQLEMTPMIDVVFQLLVFFVFSIKPVDLYAHLDVYRPAPDPSAQPEEEPEVLTIQIDARSRIFVNDRMMSPAQMESVLIRLGQYSESQTVMIKCDRRSKHNELIVVLDKCALARLNNLNIVSM